MGSRLVRSYSRDGDLEQTLIKVGLNLRHVRVAVKVNLPFEMTVSLRIPAVCNNDEYAAALGGNCNALGREPRSERCAEYICRWLRVEIHPSRRVMDRWDRGGRSDLWSKSESGCGCGSEQRREPTGSTMVDEGESKSFRGRSVQSPYKISADARQSLNAIVEWCEKIEKRQIEKVWGFVGTRAMGSGVRGSPRMRRTGWGNRPRQIVVATRRGEKKEIVIGVVIYSVSGASRTRGAESLGDGESAGTPVQK